MDSLKALSAEYLEDADYNVTEYYDEPVFVEYSDSDIDYIRAMYRSVSDDVHTML